MRVREASDADLDSVFSMAYDVWGEGRSPAEHVAHCRAAPKYKAGRWYVLEEGALKSALIAYPLAVFPAGSWGLGTISTPPELRRRGCASRLIRGVIGILEAAGAAAFYLHSEIEPRFYERFGFVRLPDRFQKHPGSVCMVRAADPGAILAAEGFEPPPYF